MLFRCWARALPDEKGIETCRKPKAIERDDEGRAPSPMRRGLKLRQLNARPTLCGLGRAPSPMRRGLKQECINYEKERKDLGARPPR